MCTARTVVAVMVLLVAALCWTVLCAACSRCSIVHVTYVSSSSCKCVVALAELPLPRFRCRGNVLLLWWWAAAAVA